MKKIAIGTRVLGGFGGAKVAVVQSGARNFVLWPRLAVAWLCYGCAPQPGSGETSAGSEDTGSEDTGSEGPTEPGPSPGQPGAPCQTDADCLDGGACLPPAFTPEGDRVCGPPCNVTADCDALAALDYYLEVGLPSPSGEGNNLWNSHALYRGHVCEAGHCQFLCPENGAVAYGADDNAIGCACLPHFTFNDDQTHCFWDENVPCAILEKDGVNPCNACNSEQLFPNCSTGRFQCLLYTETFAGYCVEWAEASELKACAEGNVGYDCDPECYSNCAEAQCTADFCNIDSDGCLNVCCVATDSSPDPEGCDPAGGKAPVMAPCTHDSDCASGWCDDWCVGACDSSEDCVGDSTTLYGDCVMAIDDNWYCFPDCTVAEGCAAYPGTFCEAEQDIDGNDVEVCAA